MQGRLVRQDLQWLSKSVPMSQRAVIQVYAEFDVVWFFITMKLWVLLVMRHALFT